MYVRIRVPKTASTSKYRRGVKESAHKIVECSAFDWYLSVGTAMETSSRIQRIKVDSRILVRLGAKLLTSKTVVSLVRYR